MTLHLTQEEKRQRHKEQIKTWKKENRNAIKMMNKHYYESKISDDLKESKKEKLLFNEFKQLTKLCKVI